MNKKIELLKEAVRCYKKNHVSGDKNEKVLIDFIDEIEQLILPVVGINEVALAELQEQYNQKCLQKRYLQKDLDEANKILIDNGLKQNPIQSNISRKA